MIDPALEQAQNGTGAEFIDSVSVHLWDPEHALFGLFRLSRLTGRKAASALGLVFADGETAAVERASGDVAIDEWERAALGGVRMATQTPLDRWSVSFSSSGVEIELEASAASPPLDVAALGEDVARLTGMNRYEQVLRLTGTAAVGDRRRTIECSGMRVHCWGTPERRAIDLWRSVHAAAEGRAFGLVSARPAGSKGHGDEVQLACRFPDGAPAEAFEEARLSTVYRSDGLPLKAGLELYPEGEELPRRIAGQALCGTWVDGPDERLGCTFFGWSWDGEPAIGSYEIVSKA